MKKVSIADAADHFGVSKEAIHNRIRRGSLQVVVENDVKMVLLDTTLKAAHTAVRRANTPKNDVSNDRYYKFLEEQNAKLQSRVETLETETRSLRDQKELMLIEERKKIEQIYKEKDEQLKNILTTLSSKFMLSNPAMMIEEASVETVDADIEVETTEQEPDISAEETEVEETEIVPNEKVVSLKKYLSTLKLPEKLENKVKKRFRKKAEVDRRIITIGSKIYLNLSRYDYSDFIKQADKA